MPNFLSKITDFLGGGRDADARAAIEAALGEYQDIPTPDQTPLASEDAAYLGDFDPDTLGALSQGRTELEGVEVDPRLKSAQLQALEGFQDIVDTGGQTAEDKYRLAKIQGDQAAQERGGREAILDNARQRGIAGSGLELLSTMQNQQDSATRANLEGLNVNAQAEAAKRDALAQLASTGGAIRSQDYGEQSDAAAAQDAINRFNTANSQDVAKYNVGTANTAGLRNLETKQDLSNANTAGRNADAKYNVGAGQRQFENELSLAGAKNQVRTGQANQAASQAGATRGVVGGVAQAIAQGASAASGSPGAAAAPKAQGMAGQPNRYDPNLFMAKEGGLVPGQPTDHDSVPAMLQPGEMIIPKDRVADVMKRAHTDENGEFDVAGFMDAITGGRYRYRRG